MSGIPREALARRLAFVGTTGSGKTYTAKGGIKRKLRQASASSSSTRSMRGTAAGCRGKRPKGRVRASEREGRQ
ncbi:hypothetical protein NB311A_06638 [Nitrobacter sp. Nb-311A]|uniref:hypothetical protein n=1 Tax=unclassified Nitrobacter TaxID=2620411 RepID=UPI000068717F|nr:MULTISPECIES: hypothetical protein [unclassified Nitrobacter]EAQ34055.1 hypothetical protein NB311A_06638 [Nitrobacter sp. Nb-311A]MCB1393883.1 hypothetical protein [Nitrobacter sp.]MCV0388005.1 ATP-binding protein [Nitrobacter sp.]